MFAETRKSESSEWKKVGNIFTSVCGPTDRPYCDRNSRLFALLADVRNEYNFDPIKRIAYKLPEDISNGIFDAFVSQTGVYAIGYYTLQELIEFNWDFTFTNHGVISPTEIAGLLDGKIPTEYCGMSNLQGYEYREWEERFESSFVTEAIPELKKLGSPDNVRIVFWFDN
jgi:hypothetical protein